MDMRKPWADKNFVNFGRWPSLNSLLLYFIIVVALITVLSSPYPATWNSVGESPVPDIYKNYRRLREQTTSDLLEIQALFLGITPSGELQLCGKERENHVPCYNVSANLLAGFHDGDEFDRHCEVDDLDIGCLIRPPKDYKIPLQWPAGKDVIWSGNVKITKDQFLSSGSMKKR